ncbi:protein-associating with the carboxyl-terminal domain of ezrin [Toxorhynchites rutilus septentrionalis]|uniref:protein-associating with the carboxyl-terminal domain of ezrin n=1 Tax=Toxorhynchites rutilus septentrionalis TaxID=329112 RepID=UPI002479A083|nr:protein-associating with the carboxyl-terminal domain of ezrin [Toxorhynchites rutilus septentrionalis]
MGNDQSQLKGLEISKKAIQVTDFWSVYNGEIPTETSVSYITIFQGETLVTGQFWTNLNPLERAIKNLKIYRHPNILKYIASWNKGSLKMLATERCRPLATCLNITSDVQICLGLRNILCALIFLIEQANVRHLSISMSSIYVTEDGAWRLAGFEHLWAVEEFNLNLLEKAQPYRYGKAIDPDELKNKGHGVEQFAFAIMCEEILHNKSDSNIPAVEDFKSYCATHLKHANVSMRPKLSAILLHPLFNHDFILIHSFLTELPLKSPQAKQEFFTGLADRLRTFDPETVAEQMGSLLLSRIVLLDTTAQLCVTPHIMRPKTDDLSPDLFAAKTFSAYIIPKIKQVFCVQDAQIRLTLLEYFPAYVDFFSKEELKEHVLPQLLLGIKDTNDVLVAKTLLCLADLVPILGSAVVIGGNRSKIFADGRPQGVPDQSNPWSGVRSITPVLGSGEFLSGSPTPGGSGVAIGDNSVSFSSMVNGGEFNFMPERLSPEGEDIYHTNSDVELEVDEWSDWENDSNEQTSSNSVKKVEEPESVRNDQITAISKVETIPPPKAGSNQTAGLPHNKPEQKDPTKDKQSVPPRQEESIENLDIKTQTFKKLESSADEMDFFKDMEPVIQKANVLLINDDEEVNSNESVPLTSGHSSHRAGLEPKVKEKDSPLIASTRFDIKAEDLADNEDGWDDEESEW